jgi:hypothetical protein
MNVGELPIILLWWHELQAQDGITFKHRLPLAWITGATSWKAPKCPETIEVVPSQSSGPGGANAASRAEYTMWVQLQEDYISTDCLT